MNGVLTRTTTRRAFRWTRPQWTGRCDLPVGRVHGTNAGECLRRESGDETAQSAGAGHERARPSVGRTGVTCCVPYTALPYSCVCGVRCAVRWSMVYWWSRGTRRRAPQREVSYGLRENLGLGARARGRGGAGAKDPTKC